MMESTRRAVLGLISRMDIFSKEKRSDIMSKVKSSGNRSTEQRFILRMREFGITGWRRKFPLIGKPDFVFPKQRVAVFIDGCYWHACTVHGHVPATNKKFWREKFARNTARDRKVNRELKKSGWVVVRFWEHDLKGGGVFTRKMRRLESLL